MIPDLPSKAALKKKYGIANDDFKILTTKPTKEELKKEGNVIEQVASWCGFSTYIISTGALVVGVLLLPATVMEFQEHSIKSFNFYRSAFAPFNDLPPHPKGIALKWEHYATTTSSNVAVTTTTYMLPPRGV